MKHFLIIIFCSFFVACSHSDEQKIIGIWQNESDWFNIKKDNKYDTGTGPFPSFTNMQYLIDPQKKEINFYTNNAGKTLYLDYQLIGNDTLILKSKKENTQPIQYHRVNKIPTKFN